MKQKTRDNVLITTQSNQDRTLSWLYRSVLGRFLLKLITKPGISKLVGKFLSSKASRIFIKSFIRKHSIDMSQFEAIEYGSYNAFFSRKICPEVRQIDTDPRHLISPCDSKLTVLPVMEGNRFQLKNTEYTVASLLRDEKLAATYEGGYALIFRLTVDDYHRYCYIADGNKEENIYIPGFLHTVNPIANDYFPIYKENSREYSILHSDYFDDVVMMEVGAMLVGKIVNHHGRAFVMRGQEKGYFQFGGSTVVLLIKADTVQIDEDILKNSNENIETIVRYGEKIGLSLRQ